MLRVPLLVNFSLPDDTSFYVVHNGRPASLRIKMKEGALLVSYTGSNYRWLEDHPELASLQLRFAPSDGPKIPYREIRFKPNESHFSGGLIEHTRYALIETMTQIDSTAILEDAGERETLKGWLGTLLDRFVDWYRLLTNESDLPRPNIADVPVVELWVAEDGTLDELSSTGTFRPLNQTLQWKPPHVSGRVKNMIAESAVAQLVNALRSDQAITLHQRLLMDARAHSLLYHQHDTSIVLSATALEVCARHCVLRACERRGLEMLPSGRGASTRELPYRDAVERADVLEELLTVYPDKLVRVNLRHSSQYQAWHRDSYKPRRAILHRGEGGFTESHARRGFDSVVAFMALIEQTLSA